MSRSSDRGGVEPLAALVAVFAVSIGLALYAGVLDDVITQTGSDRNLADPTADAVQQRLSTAGVVEPRRVERSLDAIPSGYAGNVTLRTDVRRRSGERWTAGPVPPEAADRTSRAVSVRNEPGTLRRGRLTVWVWR